MIDHRQSLRVLPAGLVSCLLLFPSLTLADKADDVVRAAMKNYGVPGVSVAVIRDGKVIKLKGYGYANLEHMVKVTPETIFDTGSIAKQFTAALVMKLVGDGKIRLDDSIRRYLPEAPEAWEKITIRQILLHESGLSRDAEEKFLEGKEYTADQILKILGELPFQFKPGEDWGYSNVGYEVLAILCARVGGSPFGDQLKSRIFEPAGMKTARVISETDIVKHRATGYLSQDGKLYNQPWSDQTLNRPGPGGLYVSLIDMVNWNAALDGDKLFSESVKRQMWTPSKYATYGFGWMLGPTNGHKGISHSGSRRGFRTSIRRYPDDKLAVIVLANSNTVEPHKLSQQIAACYVPELARLPRKAIPDTAPGTTKILLSLLDGDATNARKLVTEDMWAAWKKEGFEELVKDLRSTGARNLLEPVLIDQGGREVIYRVRYGKQSKLIKIFLNEKGLIEGLGTDIDD
ncbi:MAG: beta-lactamase family protein [Armatimonadetes bacterium]|nr:beta-lactamase family protein [Armatimonadota bacterium]